MPHIIAILNSKGGTGKTTLTINLAGCLHKMGHSVLIVDSDPQGTARDWHSAQPEDTNLPAVVGIDRPTVHKDVPRIAKPYDFVLIDGAAKLEDMSASALKAADTVLIPVQPSGFDLWAAADLVGLIRARQEVTDGKPLAAFIVSRQIKGTHLAQEANDAIKEFQLPVFEARTTQRVAYTEAGGAGLTVLDLEPNGKAAQEIEAITRELLRMVNHEQSTKAVA